jgi:HPt (histidine-containing phosphotransfer) domain-containing protein
MGTASAVATVKCLAQACYPDVAKESETMNTAHEFPLVDEEVLQSFREGLSEDKFLSLMRRYLTQAGVWEQQFATWNETSDLDTIQHEAHKIIASAGTFGARRAQELATQLETACRSGDKSSVPTLINELEHALTAASSILEARLVAGFEDPA